MTRKDLGYAESRNGFPNVDLGAGLYASVPIKAIIKINYD